MGLPTAEFVEVTAGSDWQAVIEQLGAVFVKPACGGSSIATARAETESELREAWREAHRVGGRVIAERLIRGPEYTVSILGERALPAITVETSRSASR